MMKDYIYRSYDESYLKQATNNLGDMMQYACKDNFYNPDTFFKMFLDSGIAREIEVGNPSFVAGKSGVEIADEVLKSYHLKADFSPVWDGNYSNYYWAGWIIGQYQWYTSKTFADIWKYMSITKLLWEYPNLHQRDIMQALEKIDKMVSPYTKLTVNSLRKIKGLSQNELAKRAHMDISQIQRLEYGERKVENLTLKSAINLANALGVDVRDIA